MPDLLENKDEFLRSVNARGENSSTYCLQSVCSEHLFASKNMDDRLGTPRAV
jgi:hypothetical protein